MLATGTIAPAFTLLDQNKESHTLADYAGQWVLVYFYPMDDTPGCTTEACTIAEVYGDFKNLSVKVFGISKDSADSHKAFAEKYNLPFTLLSDEGGETIEAYGATDAPYNKRISYLLTPNGTIARAYADVDPANHALELLADIKLLQGA